MTSQIGTHFNTRNTRNPTLGAGCRFECEPRIDILKQYSLFKHFLYQNSRTTACSDTTIETIMRDSTSVFGVQLKNTNLTPILVRKKFKNLFLHCWNCIQICHLLVWPISSSLHNAFSEKKGQKWWKIAKLSLPTAQRLSSPIFPCLSFVVVVPPGDTSSYLHYMMF